MTTTVTPPLAALTTIFHPPCPTTWLLTSTGVPFQYPTFPPPKISSCDPPRWGEYLSQRGFAYYSPAICPSGFSVGPSCIITEPRTYQGFPAIQEGESAAYCIPNGHTCTSDTSDYGGGAWGVLQTASARNAEVTVGPAIQIRWRAEDLGDLETNPLSPGVYMMVTTVHVPSERPTVTTEKLLTYSPLKTARPTPEPSSTMDLSTIELPSQSVLKTKVWSAGADLPMTESLSSTTNTLRTELSTTRIGTSQPLSGEQGPQSTQTEGPVSSTGDEQGDNRSKEISSNITIAAVVLSAVLIAMIIACSAWLQYDRRRRRRRRHSSCSGESEVLPVWTITAWVRRQLSRIGCSTEITELERAGMKDIPDAELGTDSLPELPGTAPLGTMENPAELPTLARWSWMSQVSKILTVRPRHRSSAGDS